MIEQNSVDLQFSKRFSKNIISNIIYFILNIIIGLALVPFFLDTLGPTAYALIPLATSVTSYVTILIDSLNLSITRFLTLDLQMGDMQKSNITFNSALFGVIIISLVMVPIIILISWVCMHIFDIGEQAASSAFLLFVLVFGASLVRLWSTGFMTTLFAYNRLDLRNYVNICNILTQLIIVIGIFTLFGPSLVTVGLSYFIAAIITVVLSRIFALNICPFLKIDIRSIAKKQIIEMSKTSGYAIVNQLGYLFRLQLSLIIVNLFYGAVLETQFSLALMWFNLLSTISGLLMNQFTPLLYFYSSSNDIDSLEKSGITIMRMVGVLMVLPVGLVCLYASQLMTIWVGAEYAFLAPLIWLLIIPLVVRIPGNCVFPIVVAYNKVQIAAIVSISIGILNLILALCLPKLIQNGMYGVADAWFISMIVEACICLLYIAYVIKKPLITFVKPLVPCICCYIFLLGLGYIAGLIYVPSATYLDLLLVGFVISALYLIFIFLFIFNETEKKMLRDHLPKSLKKLFS